MSRTGRAVALGAIVLVAMAGPAAAHEELQPAEVRVGQAAFVTLAVANEGSAELTRIELTAPDEVELGKLTRSPVGWSATVKGATATWTGGVVGAGRFDEFGIELEDVTQAGPLDFAVVSTFSDGDVHRSRTSIEAVIPGAGPGTTEVATTTPAATSAPVSTTLAPTSADDSDDGSGDDDGNGVATALSILAVVLAAIALAVSLLRGRPRAVTAAGDAAADAEGDRW